MGAAIAWQPHAQSLLLLLPIVLFVRMASCENKKQYMEQLDSAMQELAKEGMFAPWE
jgi:hypothetical protein